LLLRTGDCVKVTERDESGWWFGINLTAGSQGLFPKNYVRVRSAAPAPPPPPPKRPDGLAARLGSQSEVSLDDNTCSDAAVSGVSAELVDMYGGGVSIAESRRFSITSLDGFDELMDSGVCVEVLSSSNITGSDACCVQPGMLVTLQCRAMIWDGAETVAKPFAETRDGVELRFLAGRGHVTPGLDCAMSRLRVGDKATVACNPAMCYGEAGQPPAVPLNASIVYELAVLSAEAGAGARDVPSGPPLLVTNVVESRRLSMRSRSGQLGGADDAEGVTAGATATANSTPFQDGGSVRPTSQMKVQGVDNPLSDDEIRSAVAMMGLATSRGSSVGMDDEAPGPAPVPTQVPAPVPVPAQVQVHAPVSVVLNLPPAPTASDSAPTSASSVTVSISCHSYAVLKAANASSNEHGLDLSRKEQYLSDEEFSLVFGTDKAAYAAMAEWKKIKLKKSTGLF